MPAEANFGRSVSGAGMDLRSSTPPAGAFLRQKKQFTNDKSRSPARRQGFQLCCARLSIMRLSHPSRQAQRNLAPACALTRRRGFLLSQPPRIAANIAKLPELVRRSPPL